MTELVKVFVYGTLKKGFANHYFMQNRRNGVAHFITTGHTKDAFPLVVGTDASIPFMLPVKNQGKQVHGEVYEVDENVLSELDDLENHPTWYKRSKCDIITTQGATGIQVGDIVPCFAYFLTDFKESFLSQDFLSEYTLECNQAHLESDKRSLPCDVIIQSQRK